MQVEPEVGGKFSFLQRLMGVDVDHVGEYLEIDRLIPFGAFEIAFWVGTLAALGLFMANHGGEMRFLVPALLMHVWTLVIGVVGLRQRSAMRALDYSQPMLAAQKALETLRIGRLRTFKWALLTGQIVLWIPLAIVLFQGLLIAAAQSFLDRLGQFED